MSELLLVGASGLAREALTVLRASGEHEVIGFLDDDPGTWGRRFDGVTVLGSVDSVIQFPAAMLLLCPGNGTARSALASRLGSLGRGEDGYVTVIDDSVVIPPSCRVGVGCILLAGAVLTTNIEIGRHVVVMPNVTLTHDNLIEPFATVCAGAVLGGNVWIGEGATIGMNASVRQGVKIGKNSVLGMGAALLADLPAGEVWGGIPARPLRVDVEVAAR